MYSANRASSAVDKDIRSFRDRYTMSSDARPSTTHAMRVSAYLNLYTPELDHQPA